MKDVIVLAGRTAYTSAMAAGGGAYLADWRIPDANLDIYSPEHIAVSPDGSTIYATDLAANRVLVLSVRMPNQGR